MPLRVHITPGNEVAKVGDACRSELRMLLCEHFLKLGVDIGERSSADRLHDGDRDAGGLEKLVFGLRVGVVAHLLPVDIVHLDLDEVPAVHSEKFLEEFV